MLTFKAMRYAFPAKRPAKVFFSCETAENTARKARFEVCKETLYPVFNSEKKPAFEQKLTRVKL